MLRVAPGYTPPELRGRGYASASIYQRIGYRPVEGRVVLRFSDRSLPAGNLAFPG